MNIAFDLHKTLDTHKNIKRLFWLMVKSHTLGTNVFIISGPPEDEIREKLINIGIPATTLIHIISIVDFLKKSDLVLFRLDKNHQHWCSPIWWWKSKGIICEEYKIDIIFDDKIEYKAYMPKRTCFIHIT